MDPMCMCSGCGRRLEYGDRTHVSNWENMQTPSRQAPPGPGNQTFLLWDKGANRCTTVLQTQRDNKIYRKTVKQECGVSECGSRDQRSVCLVAPGYLCPPLEYLHLSLFSLSVSCWDSHYLSHHPSPTLSSHFDLLSYLSTFYSCTAGCSGACSMLMQLHKVKLASAQNSTCTSPWQRWGKEGFWRLSDHKRSMH